MEMKVLKCSECGGAVFIKKEFEKCVEGECSFCHTTYIIDLQKNETKINVEVHNSMDQDIITAYKWYDVHNDIKKSVICYKNIQERDPADYRGFWGELVVSTYEFDYKKIPWKTLPELCDIKNYAFNCHIPEPEGGTFRRKWNEYEKKLVDHFNGKINKYKEDISKKQDEINSKNDNINELKENIIQNKGKLHSDETIEKYNNVFPIGVILTIFLVSTYFSDKYQSLLQSSDGNGYGILLIIAIFTASYSFYIAYVVTKEEKIKKEIEQQKSIIEKDKEDIEKLEEEIKSLREEIARIENFMK